MSTQAITVKLSRGENAPWGFRLQGGKDFSCPISIQRVNPDSIADKAGLQPGDCIVKIMGRDAEIMKHKEAQDNIMRAGNNLEIQILRGGMRLWKPIVKPVGDMPVPKAQMEAPKVVTKTSLAANKQEVQHIGSKHNVSARPFNMQDGTVKAVVHKQYNSPANIYSMDNIAETLSAHTEVLASGAKGINFLKEDAPVNKESAVYRMVHEERSTGGSESPSAIMNNERPFTLKHIEAPITKPPSEKPETPLNPNQCVECGKVIIGVFVRIKDKPLHPECFRCSTCGNSLKNVGYFNVNDKLYCDIHARQASQMLHITQPVFEPVTLGQMNSDPGTPEPVAPTTPVSALSPGPLSPSASRNISAPFSPVQQKPAAFKPLSMITSPKISPTLQSQVKPASPPIVTPPVKPMTAPSAHPTHYTHPQTAPSGDAHKPISSLTSGIGSPAPKRGRGQLRPQVGPGVRIPICAICGSPIRGPFIVALGKTWCPDHFTCGNNQCRRSLQDIGFVEEQGKLYCENCYEAYLAPVCAKCGSRIKGDCLNALDKQWHPQCFVCAYCHNPFGNSSFYMEDGQPYCEKDWNELFTTKCVGCGYPIEAGDRWVEALNNNYHSQCFKCTVCHKNLEGQSFYAKGGRPFCKAHAR